MPEAVRSLQAQSIADWDCIIVDDGSTDDSLQIAETLARGDARIRVIHQENRGLSGARNRGLQEIRGRYIQFLDADDYLANEKFEKQLEQLAPTPDLSVAYCETVQFSDTAGERAFSPIRALRLSESDPVLDLAAKWQIEGVIPVHAFLFDARFFTDRQIRFDESSRNTEDWDCWMRLFELRPRIFHLNEPLAFYRLHPDSMCWDQTALRRGRYLAIERQLARLHDRPRVAGALKERLRQLYAKERALEFGSQSARALGLPRAELLRRNPFAWKLIRRAGILRGLFASGLSFARPSPFARLEAKWRGYEIIGYNREVLRMATAEQEHAALQTSSRQQQ